MIEDDWPDLPEDEPYDPEEPYIPPTQPPVSQATPAPPPRAPAAPAPATPAQRPGVVYVLTLFSHPQNNGSETSSFLRFLSLNLLHSSNF